MPHQPAGTTGEADIAHVRRLVDRGEYLKAYDTLARLNTGMDRDGVHLQKLQSIVLSRLGMPDEAAILIESVKDRLKEDDWEIEALLGSYYKKRWLANRARDRSLASQQLGRSYESYTRARELGGDYWCAINAATMAKILGDDQKAMEHAGHVLEECWNEYRKNLTSSPFWIPATMGEACLVRGDYADAVRWYGAARSHVGGNLGWLQSARMNARLLIEAMKPDPEVACRLLDALPRMKIALFAGHRLDEKGRASTRFPERISEKVSSRLRKELAKLHPDMGIASAADGADILFHETMHGMGKSTSVILPYQIDSFRNTLLESAGEGWASRFDNVIRNAARVEVACTGRFEFSQDFVHAFCSDYLLLSALDSATVNDAELLPVVLWDGRNERKAGGTADTVAKLCHLGLKPRWIRLSDLESGASSSLVSEKGSIESIYPSNPVIKPIAVVFNHQKAGSEEDRINRITGLLKRAREMYNPNEFPFLKSAVFPEGFYLVFSGAEDARDFVSGFSNSGSEDDQFSLVLHAGVLVNLNTSLTGTRDYYFREVEEALAICRTIRNPSKLCTMQARVLFGVNSIDGEAFRYQGEFQLDDGSCLQLFDFSPC